MPSLGQDLEQHLLESSGLSLWNLHVPAWDSASGLTTVVNSNPWIISPLVQRRETDSATCPQMATAALTVARIKPVCGERQTESHKGLTTSAGTPSQGNSCPQPGELPQLPFTPLTSKPHERRAVCYMRWLNPNFGRKQEKKPQVLWPRVTWCGQRWSSGLLRKARACLGSTNRAAYLRGSLSMSGSSAHCPSGCHPFEERETLMGTKGSSKGKFLLQAGPKVPAIKEIIVVFHLAYLCPLSSRDKSICLWTDLNFQKGKHPEI